MDVTPAPDPPVRNSSGSKERNSSQPQRSQSDNAWAAVAPTTTPADSSAQPSTQAAAKRKPPFQMPGNNAPVKSESFTMSSKVPNILLATEIGTTELGATPPRQKKKKDRAKFASMPAMSVTEPSPTVEVVQGTEGSEEASSLKPWKPGDKPGANFFQKSENRLALPETPGLIRNAVSAGSLTGTKFTSKMSLGEAEECEKEAAVELAMEDMQMNLPAGFSRRASVGTLKFLMQQPDEEEGKLILAKWYVLTLLADQRFDYTMGIIILANSICMGLQATAEIEGRSVSFYASIEHVFLCMYIIELGLRFFGFGRRCVENPWVAFDLFLVCVGVISSWVIEPILMEQSSRGGAQDQSTSDGLALLSVLRILRLLRLARSVRLLVQFKALWMLVRGLLSSAGTMFYTLMLILLILYVFACLGIELITKNVAFESDPELKEHVETYFSSVAVIMLTLFQFISSDEMTEVYTPLIRASPVVCGSYFMFFILIVSISLMNLVTAVVVEGAIEQGKQDREVWKAHENQKVAKLVPTVRRLFKELDADGSGGLSIEELEECDEEVQVELQKIMQTDELLILFELLDTDGSGEISIDEFCDGISKMITSDEPMESIRMRKQVSVLNIHTQQMKDHVGELDEKVKDAGSKCENRISEVEACIQKVKTSLKATIDGRVTSLEDQVQRMGATLDQIADAILPPKSK